MIRRVVCIALLSLFVASPAMAQVFVPITVTETDVQQLEFSFANTPPMRWHDITVNWLNGLESRARQELQERAAKAKADADKLARERAAKAKADADKAAQQKKPEATPVPAPSVPATPVPK